jgi:hypothetical protein
MTGPRLIAACAALALAGGGAAQAACIDAPVVDAARLHEFETMMMDVSLRCTRMGVAMQADYDVMVSTHHGAFEAAVQRLHAFFADGADAHRGGLYDRYATLIANRYGGGNTSFDSCRLFDALAVELARAADAGRELGAVARAMIAHPLLETATCAARP